MTAERMTMATLNERLNNLNRRLQPTNRKLIAQARNGYIGLDEYLVEHDPEFPAHFNIPRFVMLRTVTTGTKRECAEFVHAMMVGIDLSQIMPETQFVPFAKAEAPASLDDLFVGLP